MRQTFRTQSCTVMTNFVTTARFTFTTDTDNCKSAIYSSTKSNCSVAWLYGVQGDYNLSEMGVLLYFVSNQYVFANWSKRCKIIQTCENY